VVACPTRFLDDLRERPLGLLSHSIGILADPLAAMMAVVVCSISFLIQVYSLEYMRGNLFANTPDILHEYLQHFGRPAFRVRLLLAADEVVMESSAGRDSQPGPQFGRTSD